MDNFITRIDYYITFVSFRQSAVIVKEKLQEGHNMLSFSLFRKQQVDNMPKIPDEKQVRGLSF